MDARRNSEYSEESLLLPRNMSKQENWKSVASTDNVSTVNNVNNAKRRSST